MKIIRFLEHSPDYQLHIAGKRAAQALNEMVAEFDVNMSQALILVALYFEDRHQSPFEDLARAFGLTKGGLSQHLSHLEGKQLVQRVQQKDKRSVHIALRKEAEPLCLKLIKIFDGHQRQAEEKLGEHKLKNFLSVLREIVPL